MIEPRHRVTKDESHLNAHTRYLIVAGLLLSSSLLVASCSESKQRSHDLQEKATRWLERFVRSAEQQAHVRDIAPADATTVCLQTPYMTQDLFMRSTPAPVKDFEMITDDVTVLWFFSKDGKAATVHIPRLAVADITVKESRACFAVADAKLNKQAGGRVLIMSGKGE